LICSCEVILEHLRFTTWRIGGGSSGFFFFIFKKIKISKIYVGFGKFQKYTPVALWGATGIKCNFFSSSNLQQSPWRKKGGPVAPPTGDRPLSPTPGATGPCRPLGGRQGPMLLAWPTKPIEFHSSSVRRFIVIYLQKDLEIEFELS